MDIVDPLPIAAAQFLLIATDYFSKWVEVEAYANIKDKDVSKSFAKTSCVGLESHMRLWQTMGHNLIVLFSKHSARS